MRIQQSNAEQYDNKSKLGQPQPDTYTTRIPEPGKRHTDIPIRKMQSKTMGET